MRQIVPHRNNIGPDARSCKWFLRPLGRLPLNWRDGQKAFRAGRPLPIAYYGNNYNVLNRLRPSWRMLSRPGKG